MYFGGCFAFFCDVGDRLVSARKRRDIRVSLDEYYGRLGLPNTASPAEIKRAHRRLRAKYHPDRNKGAESNVEPAFKLVQEAFEILTGERDAPLHMRTRAHDAARNAPHQQQEHAAGHTERTARSASGRAGAYGPNRGPLPMRGANRLNQLYVPVEVALNGGEAATRYQVTETCHRCRGKGFQSKVAQCSGCEGWGQTGDGLRCGICSGAGRTTSKQSCPSCDGTGTESYWNSDTVEVPPGAWDGQRLVVAGGGFPGVHGGAAGDAIFSIAVVCGSDFTREGLNLSGELQVDFVTATLGGSVEAKVLGRDLRVTILPNSQQGSVIRLPARGLSDKAGNQGDLRLRIALAMPTAATLLTDEQRHAFQEIFADAARRGSGDSSDS